MDELYTKGKIVKAAYDCFSDKGYHASTTKEIAKMAGVSEITLFRHFGTKESIFIEVLNRYSFLPEIKKIMSDAEQLDLRSTLILISERFYQTLLNRKKFMKIMLSEINQYSDEIVRIYENFIDEMDLLMLSILERKKGRLLIKDIDLKIAVKGFIGMIYSFFLTNEIFMGKRYGEDYLKEVFATFVDIFLHGIEEK